jgi:hypothetical protein
MLMFNFAHEGHPHIEGAPHVSGGISIGAIILILSLTVLVGFIVFRLISHK